MPARCCTSHWPHTESWEQSKRRAEAHLGKPGENYDTATTATHGQPMSPFQLISHLNVLQFHFIQEAVIPLCTAVLGRGSTTQLLLPLMCMVPPVLGSPRLLQVHRSPVAMPALQLAPCMKGATKPETHPAAPALSPIWFEAAAVHFRGAAFICSNVIARRIKFMHFRDSKSAQEDHQEQHHVPKTLHPCHHLGHGCQTPLSAERVKQGNSSSHGCC